MECKFINAYYADMTMQVELEEAQEGGCWIICLAGQSYLKVTADGIINSPHINKRYAELVNRHEDEIADL